MKYMVMECHTGYAVLLDEEGRFWKAANLHYQVGETVEDPVRMLRALKLVGQYDFSFDAATENALFAMLPLIRHAAPSRLSLELEKILSSSYGDKHLLAFHFFSSYEHVVQFSRSLGLIPVERPSVRPGEHLHILLSRTVAETLVRPEVEPAVVVSVGRLRHTDSHDHLRAALEKI